MTMTEKKAQQPKTEKTPTAQQSREKRRAQALRNNLRKRKKPNPKK